MACKIVFFFDQFRQGWTEVWYRDANDPKTVAESFTAAQIRKWLALRDQGVILEAIRVSQIGAPRNSFLRLVGAAPLANPGEDETPDVTATSALIQLTSDNGATRHLWLRGLPDDFVVRSTTGRSVPSARFNASFQSFEAMFPNINLSIRRLEPVSVNPWRGVFKVTPDTASVGNSRVHVSPGLPLPVVGDSVYFRGIKQLDLPGLRGYFQVLSIDVATNSFTIPLVYKSAQLAVFPTNASYRKATYTYPQIRELQFERFATRDTGRPTVPSRGRRAAVRLRG